ncbi:MAG TPA: hypothetical protein VFJ00_01325 [Candidatus Limnocylindria bacterium]|nr:hypothetical protein [Candidatus Limnocylindria bacterium]
MSLHIRSTAAVVLLGIVAVACGGGGTSVAPGASAGGGEATATPVGGGGQTEGSLCDAVTEQLAVAALGGPVGEPQSGDVLPRPNGIYCHYPLAADANQHVEAQLKEMAEAEFEATATQLEMSEPLEGVGDAAYQKANGIMGLPGTTIFVFGGGRGVSVAITAEGDAADQLAAAIDIAEAALAS